MRSAVRVVLATVPGGVYDRHDGRLFYGAGEGVSVGTAVGLSVGSLVGNMVDTELFGAGEDRAGLGVEGGADVGAGLGLEVVPR